MSWFKGLKEILGFGDPLPKADYSVVTEANKEVVTVAEDTEYMSEAVVAFIKTVKSDIGRFKLYRVKEEEYEYPRERIYGIQKLRSCKRDYILLDTHLKKPYLFSSDLYWEKEAYLFGTKGNVYKGEGFRIQGEDLNWLSVDDWDGLTKLFKECYKHIRRKDKLVTLKDKRKKANQRRQTRKLYETN